MERGIAYRRLTVHTPDTAASAILHHVVPLPVEDIPLTVALDRVLATDVVSPIALPHWDNSAMDGYAVRSDDLADRDTAVALEVIETVPAGQFPTQALGPGECARVFTGAPVPMGTDGVIRQEDTTFTDGYVRINDFRDAGRNVRRRGEDICEGDTALAAGTRLGPAHLAVLASLAQDQVRVHRRPVVAILASGDEIADLDDRDAILAGRKIASSNTYALIALVTEAGGTALSLGIARDDPADLRTRIQRAENADLVVTTAGVSVGEHDFLHEVIDGLGATERFWRIRMRPGAPVGFGLLGALGGTPWIGLPGNPVSTMVTFELFVRPAIRRMQGHARPFRRTVEVYSGEPISLGPALRHFLRVTLDAPPGGTDRLPTAQLTGPQGSGILTSMARADALMVVPEDRRTVSRGEVLRALVLDDPVHVEEPPW